MSKHTPGPWLHVNTADIFTALGAPRADGSEAPPDDGWFVADCNMGGLPLEEVTANARLIAAAPELLEALDDLIILAESAMLGCNYDGGEYDIDAELSAARAAIAKATGGGQ